MNAWYIVFSLIALPGILTVFLPSDDAELEEDEARVPAAVKVAAPVPQLAAPTGYLPYHNLQHKMDTYRIFYRSPMRQFF
jgi:hypothetical protein